MRKKELSYFMIMLLLIGGFAPFVSAGPRAFNNPAADRGGFYSSGYGSSVNTWQSSRST